MFKTNSETQSEIHRLVAYFQAKPDGETVTWLDIETDTGIKMPVLGHSRQNARRALRQLKRPYEAIIGQGLRLSSPTSAMNIVRGRFSRIDGAVRVADRTQRQLAERHLEQMSSDDQRQLLIASGFFGAIRAFAREARVKMVMK